MRHLSMCAPRFFASVLCLMASGLCLAAAPTTYPNDNSPLGINLSGISYWNTELPFVDGFKMSQKLMSQKLGEKWGVGDPHELRDDGYPKRILPGHCMQCLLFVCNGKYPGGQYVCLYDGLGKLDFSMDAKIKESTPGRLLLEVTPKNQILLKILETDPADPIHNIRLVRKEFESTYLDHPFDSEFLKRWENFKVIRFMDWMSTNNSSIREWSERPKPT